MITNQLIKDLSEIAIKAGKLAMNMQPTITHKTKNVGHLYSKEGAINKLSITEADLVTQKLIIKELINKKYNEQYGIIAEEEDPEILKLYEQFPFNDKAKPDTKAIVIDPIDGTKGYAEQSKEYCVMMAVLDNLEIIAGVVYYPELDTLLITKKGEGTYLNGMKIELKNKTFSSNDPIRISTSLPEWKMFSEIKIKSIGVQFLNMLQGKFNAYATKKMDLVDYSCLMLAYKEAKGYVLELKPLKIFNEEKVIVKGLAIMGPNKEYCEELNKYIEENLHT